jgi:hypothetical protein
MTKHGYLRWPFWSLSDLDLMVPIHSPLLRECHQPVTSQERSSTSVRAELHQD